MILIIDCGSKKTKDMSKIVHELGHENKIISLEDVKSVDKYSGIIISGAPILLTEVDKEKYLKKFSFIKEIEIPVLGICFGHQIIGLLHDSKIFKGEEAREKEDIELLEPDSLFDGLDDPCEFMEDHCEYIFLPECFELLAISKGKNIEAIKHKEKQIYGVQFHPEVSGENGKLLLKNFCNMIKK